jgi:hypothetical protein
VVILPWGAVTELCVSLGGMPMEDEHLPLRQRVPGAERAGPGLRAQPVLSDRVLQRMQAAVDAAKAEPLDEDPDTAPIPRFTEGGRAPADVPASAVNGAAAVSRVRAKPGDAAEPKHSTKRTGEATSAGTVTDGKVARLIRKPRNAPRSPTKPAGKARPPAEPAARTELPMRTVPTPAGQVQPPALPEAAAPAQPAAPRRETAKP